VISLCYVGFLGVIGALMLVESVNAIRRRRSANAAAHRRRRRKRRLIDALPFKTRFPVSGLYMSVIPPLAIGFLVGALAALMGVGGGFVMVPAMIYILRMPTSVVIGTSLFQILFVTALTTFLHAAQNQTVDIVLAAILIVGGVIGAQFGVRAGAKVPAEELRAALALLVVAVCLKLAWDLAATPADLYVLIEAGGVLMRVLIAALFFWLAAAPRRPRPPRIAAALTEELVEIRSDFDGAPLTVFGAAKALSRVTTSSWRCADRSAICGS
jgi:hypothetical protein